MDNSWLSRGLLLSVLYLVLALLRRYAPAPPSRFENWKYDQRQVPEPLPTGVIGGFMWTVGICLGSTFFLFRYINHMWAEMEGQAALRLYPTAWLWCFFPIFAALAIPWPLTVSLLRRMGRTDEADAIMENSDRPQGINSFVVMKWFGIILVIPIFFFTLLALPEHLLIGDTEARLGRYGLWRDEVFSYRQATRATLVEGVLNGDGSFHRQKDLLIDFQDRRRLSANAVGDGGTDADPKVIELLLAKTGLQPDHVKTPDDIPKL